MISHYLNSHIELNTWIKEFIQQDTDLSLSIFKLDLVLNFCCVFFEDFSRPEERLERGYQNESLLTKEILAIMIEPSKARFLRIRLVVLVANEKPASS